MLERPAWMNDEGNSQPVQGDKEFRNWMVRPSTITLGKGIT
jgi:hypothetical protein